MGKKEGGKGEKVEEKKKKQPEPTSEILNNPARVMRGQLKVLSMVKGRYAPVKDVSIDNGFIHRNIHVYMFVVLRGNNKKYSSLSYEQEIDIGVSHAVARHYRSFAFTCILVKNVSQSLIQVKIDIYTFAFVFCKKKITKND